MEGLTYTQERVYQWLRDRIVEDHLPPTMREIAQHFEFANSSGSRCHLIALERKGWIIRIPYQARNIRLTREPL
jgi:repressor LexA